MQPQRIVCLHVSDFPLAALLRAEPALRGALVLVFARREPGTGNREPLLACSPQARSAGVTLGMPLVQARSLLPDAVVRAASAAQVRSAQAALLDVARSCSPLVAVEPTGEVCLDARGSAHRWPSEHNLASWLLARVEAAGLEAHVGIASTRFTALQAARIAVPADAGISETPRTRGGERSKGGRAGVHLPPLSGTLLSVHDMSTGASTIPWRAAADKPPPCSLLEAGTPIRVVPPGEERAFLAALPLTALPASEELLSLLERFGISTLGQLAALPADGLERRLGPEGMRAWRLARGEDPRPLIATPEKERFLEETDLEYALERLEPLLFSLNGLAERLASRLEWRGMSARGLVLTLGIDPQGSDERFLELASPTLKTTSWLGAAKLALEEKPPASPVCSLRLEARWVPARASQLDLFASQDKGAARLDDALARIVSLVGPERAGSPRVVDSHRPEAFDVLPFVARTAIARTAPQSRPSAPWDRRLPVRAIRPAEPLEVQCQAGRPGRVSSPASSHAIQGRVVRAAGPYRLQAEWWTELPLSRDYYEIELACGAVYRVFHEPETDQWYADGLCG